uniref:Reverse transcriptase domain-containing protein n=1 Tax=Anolis carolinensis TaxID=28377 RepID=A0A803T8R1_ANOCA
MPELSWHVGMARQEKGWEEENCFWLPILLDTTLMAESKEEPRSLITKVKEENAKAGLQLNAKKTKIMATTPIDNWQIEGENVEAVTDFIFLGTKITADADCCQEIRRRLLLGGRTMANLDKIVKSRDITLATKVRIVKAMVFPIVTYGCESWTIRKAERRKIDAFELWCWRKILRVPWTARRSNQSILQEIISFPPVSSRALFPGGWTGWIFLRSKALSGFSSSTRVQKRLSSFAQPSLWSSSCILRLLWGIP